MKDTAGLKDPPIDQQLKLPRVVDALPTGVYTCDAAGRLVGFNRQCVRLWGLEPKADGIGSETAADVQFSGAFRTLSPEGRLLPPSESPMAEVLRTGNAVDGRELIVERPDGSRIFVQANAEPIFADDGTLVGGVCWLQELTERHQAEIESAKLAAIVASSDDAIVSKTLDGFITSWNAGATRIFGYTADEMIGQHITRIIPPELRSEEESILARLSRGEHIDHFETIRISKDGRRFDISVTVSPIRDKSGKLVGASKVGRDITERKNAEKLQKLLVSELSHRVKNTLATVQSIANQTVYSAKSPAEFAASFSGRLQALARTHSLLTEATWQGAELTAVIRDQLSAGDIMDDRISYSGPLLMLSPQMALHLGLVLHELATNARKYGALSDSRGRLSIRWAVRSNGGRNLLLQWQERGGPAVSVPQTRGFGSSLIEQSLETHNGSVATHYEAEGVTCDILLPLPEGESPIANLLRAAAPPNDDAVRRLPAAAPVSGIKGKHILVVDDEPLIAMDIVASLMDEGCDIVGPAATIDKALALIDTRKIDAALLDANLAGEPVDVLAAALTERNVPFAFVSGYGREGLPEAFQKAMLVKKPFQRQRLIEVVEQMTHVREVVELLPDTT